MKIWRHASTMVVDLYNGETEMVSVALRRARSWLVAHLWAHPPTPWWRRETPESMLSDVEGCAPSGVEWPVLVRRHGVVVREDVLVVCSGERPRRRCAS